MVILGGVFWHASGCPPRANFTAKKNLFFFKKVLTERFFLSN
jgi:hypothetical protein